MNKEKYVSRLNFESQKFVISKLDSIKLKNETEKLQKFADSCERYKLSCFFDGVDIFAEYNGGFGNYRDNFFNNFKIPRNAKPSKIYIKILVGNNDKVNNFEVLGCKSIKVKNEVERVLNLPEMNKWKSASQLNIKTGFGITYSFYIKKERFKESN